MFDCPARMKTFTGLVPAAGEETACAAALTNAGCVSFFGRGFGGRARGQRTPDFFEQRKSFRLRLLKGDGTALGERALKLLTARLVAITIVVPEKALAKLRAITIELDLD